MCVLVTGDASKDVTNTLRRLKMINVAPMKIIKCSLRYNLQRLCGKMKEKKGHDVNTVIGFISCRRN